jgi:hypothetical protein
MAASLGVDYSEWVTRGLLAAVALLFWCSVKPTHLLAAPAGAQEKTKPQEPKKTADQEEESEFDTTRPHAIFQGGGAILAMPAAQLCPMSEDSCVTGETALGLKLHSLARIDDFGFGAGITWALGLRPTPVAGDPSLERELTRMYFLVEGEFRYYFATHGDWEWWAGAVAGIVVIADTFSTLADREPYADTAFVGPRALTLSTEGGSVGVGVGGQWRFYDRFILGTHIRYSNWIVPFERERSPLGDYASFAGRIDVLDAGIILGYLLPI